MTTSRRILTQLLILMLAVLQSGAQNKYLGVLRDTVYTPGQFVDNVIKEYGQDLEHSEFNLARLLAERVGRKSRFVAIKYLTTDPKGHEVIASGVVAYPIEGRINGVVEVAPVCKEKSSCGSVQLFATEFSPTVVGYITVIPDMIGYGTTANMPVSIFDHVNSAKVAADMRKAAEEYLKKEVGLDMPSNSELFGYSLGASNAFSLACYYSTHPWLGVKVESLFIGGGPYNPMTALDNYATTGSMEYLFLPGAIESFRYHRGLKLDLNNIFKGRVLNDYQDIVSARLNGTDLNKIYGSDLHAIMNDDFFSTEGNADINAIKGLLGKEVMPYKGEKISSDIYVNMRHSANDSIVPVECSDELAAILT